VSDDNDYGIRTVSFPRECLGDWRGWVDEEVGRGNFENLGQLLRHIDGRRMNFTPQVADIGAIQACLRSQLLLRNPLDVAHPSQELTILRSWSAA
jgi:hypothetical protein